MKRTIFFVGSLGNGGAQRVISILSEGMVLQGLDVEIVTYYDIPMAYTISPKVKVTCAEVCTGTKSVLCNLFWLRDYFKKNAGVVLSFLAPFNMLALAAVIGTKVPIIVADRNDPRKVPEKFPVRMIRDILYGFSDQIVVQTEANKSYFRKLQNKTKVIYNPVDLKKYKGAALIARKEKIIVTAGRLMPQKNQEMLIHAFSGILNQFPEYQLVIFGEGGYRRELEACIADLGLQSKVLMPGNVNDLCDRIKAATLFVLSSDYEGMPNALIEAMCLGLPVISTKVSGATDLIQDGKNGLLVEAGDEKQLAEAMRKLLSNEKVRNDMASEAVKLADQLLPNEILNQWMEIIRRIS